MNFNRFTLTFNSDCCNQVFNLVKRGVTSCPSHAKKSHQLRGSGAIPLDTITYLINKSSGTKNYAHATTITIGNKRIGRLSQKKQYREFVRRIKRQYPFRGKVKYLYCFEEQMNGQLHAHGWTLGDYQNHFISSFSDFGKHNMNSKSFQPIGDLAKYGLYINKENAYPPLTNITKREEKEFTATTSGEVGDGEVSSTLEESSRSHLAENTEIISNN